MITYFYRAEFAGYSIPKVFHAVTNHIEDKEEVVMQYTGTSPKTLLCNLWNTYRHRNNKGINHITGDIQYCALALPKHNTVLTIHDSVSLVDPSKHWIRRKIIYLLWYYWPIRRVKVVTCISDKTRDELLSFFPWAYNKMIVVNNPVSDAFKYVPKAFDSDCPRILHIGTKKNKNLERVIEAIKDIPCELRIVGVLEGNQEHLLKQFKIRYSNVYHISDEQIVEEYRNADIISFPSTYEGFGMPIVEGLATGRVVVTSDIEPMRSLSNDCCELVDPYSVESIKNGFLRVIKNSVARNSYIADGLDYVNQFSSEAISRNYESIYSQLT